MIIRPELLGGINTPKPLHGVNPRTIKGVDWWNAKRQEVYKSTDYHCLACGVHKSNAKKHKWLEAHEEFKADYTTGKCEIISIVPLCHYCHNFIHSGRLNMIMGVEKSENEVKEILEHGFSLLSKYNLKAFPFTIKFANDIGARTFNVLPNIIKIANLKWEDFSLTFEGDTYHSKFKSIDEFNEFYRSNKNA